MKYLSAQLLTMAIANFLDPYNVFTIVLATLDKYGHFSSRTLLLANFRRLFIESREKKNLALSVGLHPHMVFARINIFNGFECIRPPEILISLQAYSNL